MSAFTAKCSAFTAFVVLIAFAQIAGGQNQPARQNPASSVQSNSEKFSGWTVQALLNERANLSTEITDLTNRIGWIQDAIAKRSDRAIVEARKKSTEELDDKINGLLGNAGIPGTPLNELDARLTQHQELLAEKQSRRDLIDGELTRRLDLERPKQTFKLEMSAVFAALVGLVILGFFVMAYRDEQVRREIFTGQAGIQFVTLFSLVIAIILFGIIDILEGKELAALLGGLSGYILGRSTSGPSKGTTVAIPQRAEVEEKPTPEGKPRVKVEPPRAA